MTRLRFATLMLALAAGAFGCSAAPRQRPVKMGPVDTGAGTIESARKHLEGRWTLLSYEIRPPGHPAFELKGQGTLIYDEFGNLDIEIRADDETVRRMEASGLPVDGPVLSTKGRTVLDMQAHTLTYVLEGQPPAAVASGPLAQTRPRHWQVEGNVLVLTTLDETGQPTSIGRWQKAQ